MILRYRWQDPMLVCIDFGCGYLAQNSLIHIISLAPPFFLRPSPSANVTVPLRSIKFCERHGTCTNRLIICSKNHLQRSNMSISMSERISFHMR